MQAMPLIIWPEEVPSSMEILEETSMLDCKPVNESECQAMIPYEKRRKE